MSHRPFKHRLYAEFARIGKALGQRALGEEYAHSTPQPVAVPTA